MKCRDCTLEAVFGKVLCLTCAARNKKTSDEFYKNRRSKGECVRCGSYSPDKTYCDICRIKIQEKYIELRKQVLDGYGNVCYCCGEVEDRFLTIDHVHNNGASHRKLFGGKGTNLLREIIKKGFPSDYQLLCFNCNCGRQLNGGVCPHKSTSTTR